MISDARAKRGGADLHHIGKAAILPGAAAAARAVFEACGGAPGWRSWAVADGKVLRTIYELLAQFLDRYPDGTAQAMYVDLRAYPGFGTGPGWDTAPVAVHAAYETFRSVYRHLWMLVRTHDERMAGA